MYLIEIVESFKDSFTTDFGFSVDILFKLFRPVANTEMYVVVFLPTQNNLQCSCLSCILIKIV